jgi:glutamyl-tRNA synthetase
MTVRLRFAPSPTGRLHVGNIRTALLNWLFARRHGGTFILRLDDTDRERSTEAFALGIEEDLRWLGLVWGERLRQSDRLDRYGAVADELRARGRLYPCWETEDELDRRRKRQLARGLPPIYDRAALDLPEAERSRLTAERGPPHWRFRLANHAEASSTPRPTPASWDDLVRGPQSIDLASLSDPVLVRADGTFLYTFTSVVDDIDLAISHVVRGEDHVTNTAVQTDIFHALGASPPIFAHHSLLVGADGQGLSKRLGSLSIASLREAGLEPMAVASHAALIGTSEAVAPYPSLEALAEVVDLSRLSRAPARFDPAELQALNARLLHTLPLAAVEARLAAMATRIAAEPGGSALHIDEELWVGIRGNLSVVADAETWLRVIGGEIETVREDAGFCTRAAELLPPGPWDATTWSRWTEAVKASTGAKGKSLFHPLRLALTGREAGPELKALLPRIGPGRAAARLRTGRG